jgi:hypothetical protein
VSRTASIQESKLKLNFPTALLQDEVSVLNSEIDGIIAQINEISSILAMHLSPLSNRHMATVISTTSYSPSSNDVAAIDISSGNVQQALESIYDSHINFSGSNISAQNSSHESKQIYFDDTNVSSIIQADDAQEAIEKIAIIADGLGQEHQDLFHSNGLINIAKIVSPEDISLGEVLVDGASVSFAKSVGNDKIYSVISINSIVPLSNFNLKKSDLVIISDVTDTNLLYSGTYEIISFTESSNNLVTVTINGVLGSASTSLTVAKIVRNVNQESNKSSLLCSARENPILTSSEIIQVCNPASVRAISSGVRPSEITASNRYMSVSIDGDTAVTLDLFNNSISKQSLDSIISKINEQCSESSYNFLAYRLDYGHKSEIVLAHNLPDSASELHTISISRSSDDGIDAAGFQYVENDIISSVYGSTFYLSGRSYNQLESKLDSFELSFSSGSLTINSSVSSDFIAIGIKKNDILTITDTSSNANDGSFIIDSVSANQMTLSATQLPSGFASSSSDTTRFRIFKNTVSFDNITFSEISSTFGAALFDLFLDANLNLVYDKRFEYSALLISSRSIFSIVDFDGVLDSSTYALLLSDFDSNSISLTINGGDSAIVKGDNSYVWVNDGNSALKIKFYIPSVSDIQSKIISYGSAVPATIYGFPGANLDSNMIIGRTLYNSFEGKLSGGINSPRILSKLRQGMIGLRDISNEAVHQFVEQPLRDLRANGVVNGLEVLSASIHGIFYKINISSGVAYVGGRRIEFLGVNDLITDIDSTAIDKIYIVIDEDGLIKFEPALPACISPFEGTSETLLGSLEFDSVNLLVVDLRLFINELDLKLLNAITVSPDSSLAHFTDLSKALKYVKRFSFIFPKAGTPSLHLKSGNHVLTVSQDIAQSYADWGASLISSPSATISQFIDRNINDGLIIDFPVNITGEGDSTAVQIISLMNFTDISYNFRGFFGVFGGGFTYNTYPLDPFISGFITIKDLKLINTRIELADLNITSGLTQLIFGVNLENVTFDFRNFTSNPMDSSIGPAAIRLIEYSDITTDKGNVSIINSNFIDCRVNLSSVSRTKNLSACNNKIMNDASLPFFNSDIYTFALADSGSNINLSGNVNTSNVLASSNVAHPNIILSSSGGWGDRINRDLKIGHDLSVENNIESSYMYSGQYNYSSSKTKTRLYTFDNLAHDSSLKTLFYDTASSGTYSTSTLSDSSPETIAWPTVKVRDTKYLRYKIDIGHGEVLTRITLGVAGGAPTYTWNIDIESAELTMGTTGAMFTSLATDTETISTSFNRIKSLLFSVTFNIVGDSSKMYFVKINTSGTTERHLYWIKATYSVPSIEATLNLT